MQNLRCLKKKQRLKKKAPYGAFLMNWVRLASHSDFFLDTSRLTLTSSQVE